MEAISRITSAPQASLVHEQESVSTDLLDLHYIIQKSLQHCIPRDALAIISGWRVKNEAIVLFIKAMAKVLTCRPHNSKLKATPVLEAPVSRPPTK